MQARYKIEGNKIEVPDWAENVRRARLLRHVHVNDKNLENPKKYEDDPALKTFK